jgi:hypothetical protein
MEYYKQIHESLEENMALLDNYPYKYDFNDLKRDVLEPHCNCEGVYLHHGLKVNSGIRNGEGQPRPTTATNNLCSHCGHYVVWQEDNWDRNSKRGRKK